MTKYTDMPPDPVAIHLVPLFEAKWSYAEFVRLMPFGESSEGQACAFSVPSRVDGDRLSGSYQTMQFPRWRADGLYIPDAHGLIETEDGRQVATHAGGYVIPTSSDRNRWNITHWLRFWTGEAKLSWLNQTLAIGVGQMIGGQATVLYFAAAPTSQPMAAPAGAPKLELLGTARWDYPQYEALRMNADNQEGVSRAVSVGDVQNGILAGSWRGWHYPSYQSSGLYQLAAHVEIHGPTGVILNHHGGLCTRPAGYPNGDRIYDAVQHATFVTEVPELAELNRTLAVGVGYVFAPGVVRLSYYGISVPT